MRAHTLFLDIFFREQVPGLVIFRTDNLLDLFGTQEHPATGAAGDPQEFSYEPCIPDMDDGLRQFDMAEMAGALACLLVAGLAPETRVDDTEV